MKRLLTVLLIVASGCTDTDHADLEAYIEEIARESAQAHGHADADSPPHAASAAPFGYAAGGLRSPFEPPPAPASSAATGRPPIAPDLERAKHHLEQFPLAQLRLVGSLSGRQTHAALVRDPDGVIHRVGVGDYMGKDFGRIRAVDDAGLVLAEIIRDAGGWTERSRRIPLGGEEESDE